MGPSPCSTKRPIPTRPRSILIGCCRKKDRPYLLAPTVTSALDWMCRRITRSPGGCRYRGRSRPTQRRPCKLIRTIYSRCSKRYSAAHERGDPCNSTRSNRQKTNLERTARSAHLAREQDTPRLFFFQGDHRHLPAIPLAHEFPGISESSPK